MKLNYKVETACLLKTFLAQKKISKKSLSAIKQNGALLVNGEHRTVRAELKRGDKVTVVLPAETPSASLEPSAGRVDILYEDEALCIVNKPAGISTMPSQLHPHDSLLERVLYYFNEQGTSGIPHIVTRLDRETSGIVIFGKHQLVHHWMTAAIDKLYLCAVQGNLAERGVIDLPIRRKADSIIERETASDGKPAMTSYIRLLSGQHTVALVKLHTGRTHQIRVHFKTIGHPLLGDTLYGQDQTLNRQALHAYQVRFHHPVTAEEITVQAPLPSDLNGMIPI
ncbi:RluA family pseudouridine synthase [Macrococcus hajekii]|uniref:Pseudouridine synthase n=1 Tax=Macrococcus hajekii TaxID=198482 RepID=A0A4R6BP09_9STAP|nr:RluA family pseudouridine synthase [Macrococcus hajekii]TDM03407.1 RluA family pseudouridine synthase [Macrococcus hajekii]GGA98620.1 RNA pseudouridine synthase [Macrococcus hajekii]